MKNLFIPYELAVKLKEKGFHEECIAYYHVVSEDAVLKCFCTKEDNEFGHSGYDTPTWQQAIDWFREQYNIDIWVRSFYDLGPKMYQPVLYQPGTMIDDYDVFDTNYDSEDYYKALLGGIEEALKLI